MEFKLDRKRPAGLILDLQRLFTSDDGPIENPDAINTINAINGLAPKLRERNIPIIVSSYVMRPDRLDAGLLRDNPYVQQGLFASDSEWMEIDPRLQLDADVIRLYRSRPNAFFGGQLNVVLNELGCDALILAGLSVNNAISSTARAAFEQDIPVILPRNCVGSTPWEAEHDVYFTILDQWSGQVVDGATEAIGAFD